MAEPFVATGNGAKNIAPKMLLALFVSALLIAGYLYGSYRNRGPQLPIEISAVKVSVDGPSNLAEINVAFPISINALATGPSSFFSMELWVNGELTAVQAGPSAGANPFGATFSWIPPTQGAYSLVSRVVDGNNQIFSSNVIFVFAINNEEITEELAQVTQEFVSLSQDSAILSYSPPGPVAPSESVGDSQPWTGSPADWITNLTTDTLPLAPQLLADSNLCATTLSIRDHSENEQGFVVYRAASNSLSWEKVATLAAQSQTDWITYVDNGIPGASSYYVDAFNSQGIASSNLSLVNIDPLDCPATAINFPVLTLELVNFMPEQDVDNVYCYRTFDGVNWSRWPLNGFLNADVDGAIDQILLADNDGEELISTYEFSLECWAWQSGQLIPLGNYFNLLDPTQMPASERIPVITDGFTAEILLKLAEELQPPIFNTLEGDLDFEFFKLLKIFLPPVHPKMVNIVAKITYDPAECASHLPPLFQNDLGKGLFCSPSPGYSEPSGKNPQPYLVWNFTDTCLNGQGTPQPCKDYYHWLSKIENTGGQIGFTIGDLNNLNSPPIQITSPELFSLAIQQKACTGERSFTVRLWYKDANKYKVSPLSNLVSIPCEPPKVYVATPIEEEPQTMKLEFSFDKLVLAQIDDNDSGTQTLELMATWQIYNDTKINYDLYDHAKYSSYHTFTISKHTQESYCPDDIYDVNFTLGDEYEKGCPYRVFNGNYQLAGWYMDKAEGPSCASPAGASCNFEINNNSAVIVANEGDLISIFYNFHDWDDWPGANDKVCWGKLVVQVGSWEEWKDITNRTFATALNKEDGSCVISGVINAIQ